MSKVLLGEIVADQRGSVGGTTWSRCVGGGHIRKTKPIPSVSTSARQTFVRSLLPHLAGLWRGLSDVRRSEWATYAGLHPVPDVFGVPRIYPGYNYFLMLNYVHAELDLPVVLIAPVAADDPIGPAGMIVVASLPIGFTVKWTLTTGLTMSLDVSKFGPASAGRYPQIGDVRHLCYFDPAISGVTQTFLCPTGRVTLFGRHVDHVTGLISPFLRFPNINVG